MKLINCYHNSPGVKAYLNRFTKRIQDKAIEELLELSGEIKDREYNWEYQYCDESMVCKYISATTWDSFCRFGDRNRATEAMILRWIRNGGEPLDVQAMWLERDSGRNIRPVQFAEFMMEYDHGCNEFPYHKQTGELKALFKELTGFNWTCQIHAWLENLHTQPIYSEPALITDLPF